MPKLDDTKKGFAAAEFANMVMAVAPDLNTPSGALSALEKILQNGPIPGGMILRLMNTIEDTTFAEYNQLAEKILPHILDDAFLDKNEAIQMLAKIGNETPELKDIKPADALIKQAAQMLKKLGIEDSDGHLATGLAKCAVIEALDKQFDEGGKLEQQPPAQKNSPIAP